MHLVFEWWLQLWPNMFAVSVWTTGLFAWHHRSIKKHVSAEHKKTREAGPGLTASGQSAPPARHQG